MWYVYGVCVYVYVYRGVCIHGCISMCVVCMHTFVSVHVWTDDIIRSWSPPYTLVETVSLFFLPHPQYICQALWHTGFWEFSCLYFLSLHRGSVVTDAWALRLFGEFWQFEFNFSWLCSKYFHPLRYLLHPCDSLKTIKRWHCQTLVRSRYKRP